MLQRRILLIAMTLLLGSVILAACQATDPIIREVEVVVTEVVEVTRMSDGGIITEVITRETQVEVPVTVEVTTVVEVGPAETDVSADGEPLDTYAIGIFEDPKTLNYWSYMGPDGSVWTAYVLADTAPSLYTLSDQRFDFIPELATDLPPEPVEEDDGTVSVTVAMVEGAVWSDGEPIDANDVVFTYNTCLNLALTGSWPNACSQGVLLSVEAVDDYTVKFNFSAIPGLSQWQYGSAQGPILPEHFWADTVAEASAFVEGIELPADCGEEASEDELIVCEAYENARKTLYGASFDSYISGGDLITGKFEPGAFVQREVNSADFLSGVNVIEYDDGTYREVFPDGSERSFYGDASGEETLNYTHGSPTQNVIHSIYSSQDAAYLALQDGEVDYVLNPLGAQPGLVATALQNPNVTSYTNPDNGVFYFAFNMRKAPFDDQVFRTAVDILIDKEFVTDKILQGTVFPAYSVVPPGNGFWHQQVNTPNVGLSREDRVNIARDMLLEAGYSWDVEPAWSEDNQDVTPGEGFKLPNGDYMEEAVILGPGPSYDPQRATFNQWISEWMREMGMPVESELTGFNTILNPVFVESTFDMYILGWSLGIYPNSLCDFFHSKNDTATTGNLNTAGHSFPEYDALCDAFESETDIERAKELASQLQDQLGANLPYINLFYRQSNDLAGAHVIFPYTDTLGGIPTLNGFQSDATVLSK